jgi:hypothetical protein
MKQPQFKYHHLWFMEIWGFKSKQRTEILNTCSTERTPRWILNDRNSRNFSQDVLCFVQWLPSALNAGYSNSSLEHHVALSSLVLSAVDSPNLPDS